MSVVLSTGAATAIGHVTPEPRAVAGHPAFPSMRNVARGKARHAKELLDMARRDSGDLRIVELAAQSGASADAAVETILSATGELHVVIHNTEAKDEVSVVTRSHQAFVSRMGFGEYFNSTLCLGPTHPRQAGQNASRMAMSWLHSCIIKRKQERGPQ